MTAPLIVHATCVADGPDRGLLILGPSGAGKSSLALQLIGLGLSLVADDRVELHRAGDGLMATCPAALQGLIEARGVGLLRAPTLPNARLLLAVDLGQEETERMPPHRSILFKDMAVPLVFAVRGPHFPSSLLLALRGGMAA